MTRHVVRLYAAAGALAVFFLAWAGIAARPWAEQPRDSRLAALDRREERLRRDATLVQQLAERRRTAAPVALPGSGTGGAVAPAPSARIVSVAPVATTRSS